MKHLFASLLTVVCYTAMAQFPSLPYNPDENGDGLIGVVDLQGLLANYGNEFASAVLSNDSSSALLFTGVLKFPVCCQSCDELPGHWDVATFREVGPVWEEIIASVQDTWFGDQPYSPNEWQVLYWDSNPNPSYAYMASTKNLNSGRRCYCAAKQLPRVEYTVCASSTNQGSRISASSISGCCESKVADGWIPLGGTSESDYSVSQAFWRWAE